MKFTSNLYIFALTVLCSPGFFIKYKTTHYILYSFVFTLVLYITFDFVNKYTENYEQYNVDVKGVDSLVDLIKTQGGDQKKIDINNQLFQVEGTNDANCWNALGKNQKELEIIKVQLDSYAGSTESVDKLNNQLDSQKQEVEKLQDGLKGFEGTKTEIDQINIQIKNYQGEIDKLKQQLMLFNQTEKTIGEINNQISKVQTVITDLNIKISTCNTLNTGKEENITTLTRNISGQGSTISSLETKKTTLTNDIASQNGTITSLQSRINSRDDCQFELNLNPDTPVNGVSWSLSNRNALLFYTNHYYFDNPTNSVEIRFNRPIRFVSYKGHIAPLNGYFSQGYQDYNTKASNRSNILRLIYKNNGVEVGNQTIYADQMPSNREYTLGTINSTYTGLIDSIYVPTRPNHFYPTFTNFTVSN